MELHSSESSNWLFDYEIMGDISVTGGPLRAPASGSFSWGPQPFNCSSNSRLRPETNGATGSKACREKLRRDCLNERFLELGSIVEPGRPAKTDKTAILIDAIRMMTQLRSEAQKLKKSNEDLQLKIKELKSEKNELRDEKQRLKADKEKLEQQVSAMSGQSGFLPHSSSMVAAFAAEGQASRNKLIPFIGYPSIAMWQFMPPALVDTSQDHVLRPPVA
ncbi:hypothetical protein F2P56_001798 [Juglans regia]|uniref:Transcription factor ILR3-like isoform X2 n=2 Tax=Juglans regia TaxID=51240 RepID=A0A2I4GR99_JUGRE|nr:transcription factor ILR3-like isoform X2 [Juglans regia]KAF5481118.1 hypothetical protein F2P56_001798 [Juglans regia]